MLGWLAVKGWLALNGWLAVKGWLALKGSGSNCARLAADLTRRECFLTGPAVETHVDLGGAGLMD